jgi:predicted transcriptional regulator
MKREDRYLDLSSRERQIMEIVFRRGSVTVSEIRADLPDAPTAPAVRTMLARLEEKGYLKHTQDGPRNVYAAAVSRQGARRSAVRRMMQTFFDGSPVKTVATILDETDAQLGEEELAELTRLIERARRRGK